MVPGVDDACSDVLSLWRSLFYTRRFPDVNGQVSLRLGHVDVPRAAAIAVHLWSGTASRTAVILRFNGPAKAVKHTYCAFASQLEGNSRRIADRGYE